MTRRRVVFAGRTRYRLPLDDGTARKWDALGRELDFVVVARGTGSGDARFDLTPPIRPRMLDGVVYHALLPLRVRRVVRSFGADAVMAETPQVAALARLAGVPVVAEVHGNWRLTTRLYGSRLRSLLGPVVDAISGFGIRRAEAVRALSPYTATLVEEVRGRPPDAIFATYTDLAAFTATPPARLPERPTALFVGALEPYKNVDGLVAAWRDVARRVADARLVIVGGGPQRALVEELAAELPASVEHVPRTDAPGISALLDRSTVLVIPSRYEGLGRVVIEAFARGRGVVGASAGGILDLVRHDREGLLVEPEDRGGLADALVRVLTDRELAERLGAAARERYADWHTTPEEFARRIRLVVEAALDRA